MKSVPLDVMTAAFECTLEDDGKRLTRFFYVVEKDSVLLVSRDGMDSMISMTREAAIRLAAHINKSFLA